MDLPCPEWVRHVEQRWTELGPEGRERFSLLTEINDLFNTALSLNVTQSVTYIIQCVAVHLSNIDMTIIFTTTNVQTLAEYLYIHF